MPEARLEGFGSGLTPVTQGWFVAGEGPCVILMVGSRSPGVHYPVSELAAGYGASVADGDLRLEAGVRDGRAVPARTAAGLGSSALGVASGKRALERSTVCWCSMRG